MKREGRSRGLLAGREEEEDEEEEEDLPASSSGLGLRRRERCASGEEVLLPPFTMASSLFGRLSLEEGDSANSLEVLEMKLGVEGKNQKSPLDQFSRARSLPLSSKWSYKVTCSPTTVIARVCVCMWMWACSQYRGVHRCRGV